MVWGSPDPITPDQRRPKALGPQRLTVTMQIEARQPRSNPSPGAQVLCNPGQGI